MEQQKRLLPLVHNQGILPKLVVTTKLERKIRYLSMRLPNKEWSGVLFYRTEGNLLDNSLTFICVDVHLMDIGTPGATVFKFDETLVHYMAENDLLDTEQGLIHSHNNMATFFSGTDMDTLKEEGSERPNFLSLIVNNAGTYSARFTSQVKYENKSYTMLNGATELAPVGSTTVTEYFDVKVSIEVDTDLATLTTRFSELVERKTEVETKAPVFPPYRREGNLPKNETPVQSELPFEEGEIDFEFWEPDPTVIANLLYQILMGAPTSELTGNKQAKTEQLIRAVNSINSRFKTRFVDAESELFQMWMGEYVGTMLLLSPDIPDLNIKDQVLSVSDIQFNIGRSLLALLDELVQRLKVKSSFIDYIVKTIEENM